MVACVACGRGGQRIDVIPSLLTFSHSHILALSSSFVVFREIACVNVSLFEVSFRLHIARQPRRYLES